MFSFNVIIGTGAYIEQSLTIKAIAEMVRRGLEPTVFRSANLPQGDEHNVALLKRYRNRVKDL